MDLRCRHDLVPAGITISGTTTDDWSPCGEHVHPAWDSSGKKNIRVVKQKILCFCRNQINQRQCSVISGIITPALWQSARISRENCRCHSWHRMGPGPFSRSCHSESVSSVLLKRAPVRCSLCMLHCLLACSIGLAAKGDIWWLMCSHVPPLLWAADALHRQIGRRGGRVGWAWDGQAV